MAKISLSNIAEELAVKGALTREAADNFVRAIVETIEKGLHDDNIVKIKGLGTFKLMEVSDRGSIDVNTGERITIKGHTKVSFTPDSAMKEFVNRPFAHFEPTELNEGYPEDDESVIADVASTEQEVVIKENATEEDMANVATSVEAQDSEDCQSIESEETIEEPVGESLTEQTEKPTENVAAEMAEESVEEPMVEAVSEPVKNFEKQKSSTSVSQKQPSRRSRWFFALLLIALVGGVYYYITTDKMASLTADTATEEQSDIVVKTNLQEELGVEWEDVPVKKSELSQSNQASVPPVEPKVVAEVPSHEEASEVLPSIVNKDLKDITLADTTDYVIAGTQTTHVLKRGETIIQLSLKYYGDKRLWPYIVKHNSITDFNKVAIGMKINVPVLNRK